VSVLELAGLQVSYGAIRALHGIDLTVDEGEIVALLGANGAGKTTALRAVSGLIPIAGGDVRFEGASLRGLPAHAIARRGLRHVPEGRRVFARMSVRENLDLGGYGRSRPRNAAAMEEVLAIFPRLHERLEQAAGTLSGGEQQMLAIGRALMGEPRLLMLDEPSLGLAPLLVQTIFGVIRTLHERGTTILLVEQNARQALRVADRAYVLENGAIARHGPAAELLDDDAVVAAYLGMS